ncbi:MAG: hypothetical protein GF383_08745 [Candidatus Lokiarchaeota archaeon]|nr:hypothetical protein [Candidatus Lokiarchaeota archaeon]MBD3340467.1 hypothetical protein [Candidatus Lokiarchaeota archaeon]
MTIKKIWIIHNSRYGNSEKIANQIAEGLKNSYNVSVGRIKDLMPKQIAKDEPYGLIVAVRILSYMSDLKICRFIKKLDKILQTPVSKVAYYSTHTMRWRERFTKGILKSFHKADRVKEICPEYLHVQMERNKGPAVEGSDEKIGKFVENLKKFMN